MSPVRIPIHSGSGPYVEDVSCIGASRIISLSAVPRASENATVLFVRRLLNYLLSRFLSNGHDNVTLCFLVTVFPRVTPLLGAGGGKIDRIVLFYKRRLRCANLLNYQLTPDVNKD